MRASFYAALAAQLSRRPLVWHVRDVLTPGPYVRWMAHRAVRTIAVSQVAARPLPRQAQAEIVPNGVDVALIGRQAQARRAVRDSWGVSSEAPLVGLVGRLEPWKGQRDFLRAMSLVAERYPAARYALVGGAIFGGGDAYRLELEALGRELGLGERLILAGHREDLPAVLSALDVLVHCSVEPEPFGRVMIEGMAASLPVVAYEAGGASEIVRPGETGLLVQPGETRALAEGVMALLAAPDRARELGQAGRQRAERVYDVGPLTRRIESILEAAVRQEGR
jgi:glycosyltransferase involved in cell wall biosynthesis